MTEGIVLPMINCCWPPVARRVVSPSVETMLSISALRVITNDLRRLSNSHERFRRHRRRLYRPEIAAALAMQGKQVTLIFPMKGLAAASFRPILSLFLNDYYQQKGRGANRNDRYQHYRLWDRFDRDTDNSRSLNVHSVVAGIGVTPNTALAEAAGLKWTTASASMSICKPAIPIYAAGDVANYPDAC